MSKDYSLCAEAKTKHGLAADEVVSGLQKAIRRSMTELACRYAYELYTTSPVLLEKVWSRLMSISVEDIGFGNLDAARHIYVLNQMRKEYAYDDPDQPMYFIHAIRILCASEKDRSSDFLKNIVQDSGDGRGAGDHRPGAGQAHQARQGDGKRFKHFFNEGCKVIPQAEVDNDYRERYGKILEEYDPDKVEEMRSSMQSAVYRAK
ncbi:MAG: hypothetical protein ACLVJ6_03445 [Merdibacter sp.]